MQASLNRVWYARMRRRLFDHGKMPRKFMRNLSPNAKWLSSWSCRGRACGGRWRGFGIPPGFSTEFVRNRGCSGSNSPESRFLPVRSVRPPLQRLDPKRGNRKPCPRKLASGPGNCECRYAAGGCAVQVRRRRRCRDSSANRKYRWWHAHGNWMHWSSIRRSA